jgi:hypothetical protein
MIIFKNHNHHKKSAFYLLTNKTNLPVVSHRSIYTLLMNGLRRNDDAMKTEAGIQIKKLRINF